MAGPNTRRYEFGFNKKLVTSVPGPSVADNFRELKNLRYTDTHIQSVRGMSLMNSTALGGDVLSGFNFVNDDSGENYIIAHAETSGGGSAIYKSSSPEYGVHEAVDLTLATFLDEKGSITTITVDTANTSGHFNTAKGARVVAGCRMVIGGTSYSITSISGDGTANNAVVFSGTLGTGAQTVTAIYGLALDGSSIALSTSLNQGTTDICTGGTASASSYQGSWPASNAFDNNLSTAWFSVSGVTAATLTYTLASPKRAYLYRVNPTVDPSYAPKDFTFEGYHDGAWHVLDTQSVTSWVSSTYKDFTIPAGARETCSAYRLNITTANGAGFLKVLEMEIYAETVVYPSSVYYPALLDDLDTTDWSAMTAFSMSTTLNGQSVYGAVSFDDGATYSAWTGSLWRDIVQSNAGDWQYYTGTAWSNASINSALGAMAQAMGVSGNRTTAATLSGLSQAQIESAGGFSGGTASLPFMVALYSSSSTVSPTVDSAEAVHNSQANEGDFDTDPLYSCASGAGGAVFTVAPGGAIAACTGDEALIYAGREARVGSFIGYDSSVFYDYTEQVRNNINDVENSAYVPVVATPIMYVGATRPVQGFKFYVGSANAVSATVAVSYWDGNSWESVSDLVDNTSVGGKTLAISGSMSFDDTQDVARPHVINSVMLYWYKLTFSTTLTDPTRIYHVTVDSPMQPIRDLWDGEPRSCAALYKYTTGYLEYTGNVFENVYDSGDGGTFVNIDINTSQYVYVGFSEKVVGISISIYGGGGNTNASNLTVSYWNGAAWASVGTITDGTKDVATGTKTLAQSGVITWNPPAAQFEKPLVKDTSLYYYRLSVSANLSATCHWFYVTGIPEAKNIGGYSYPMFAAGRLWLLDEKSNARNQAVCSAENAPDVFNGEDSVTFTFGGADMLTAGAPLFTQFGSSLYNMTVFWKRSEIWAVIGSNPEDWTQFRVSSSTGCCAPKTVVVATINAPGNPAQNQHVAFFQSEDGVYLFDGRTPMKISGDIKNYFIQTNAEAIPANMLAASQAFYDYRNDEYHLLIASGSAATTLNKELVYDLRRNKWFEVDRPTAKKIQCGFTVQDDAGFRSYYGAAGGSVYELESGQNFAGEDIDWSLVTGDISFANGSVGVGTVLHGIRLVAGAHANACDVDVTLYADGNETGTEIVGGLDLQHTGSRVVMADIEGMRAGQRAVYHAIKLSGSVCDTEGIDLYGLGIEYSEAR